MLTSKMLPQVRLSTLSLWHPIPNIERLQVAQHIIGDSVTVAQGQEVHVLPIVDDLSRNQARIAHDIEPVLRKVHTHYRMGQGGRVRRLEGREVGSCYTPGSA